MKKFLIYLFVLGSVIANESCSKNNDDILTDNQSQTQAVTNGSWRVTLFTDSGNDETSDFNGYVFVFNSDGSLTATKNSITKNGIWSLQNSSNKFLIDLGPKTDTNKPLGELTDDWLILSISSTEIKLSDDNASSDEFLTFRKN